MRVLSGALPPDEGELRWRGEPLRLDSPHDAQARGIRMIHQELSLVPALSVAENVLLGAEPRRWMFVDRAVQRARTREVLTQLGVAVDPDTPVESLPLAARQLVEIAKALAPRPGEPPRVLVLDEPSAILAGRELEALLALVEQLARDGLAIVYISHRLDEVLRLADRVTILRDGVSVRSAPARELSATEMVRLMVGRELAAGFPSATAPPGDELLRVADLTSGPLRDISFAVRRGEIVGIAGLVGSGRTELLRALFGAAPRHSGTMLLDGNAYAPASPREAVAAGVALLPEDRKGQALLLDHTLRHNVALATLDARRRGGVWLDEGAERRRATHWVESLRIRTPSIEQHARLLSGGNQQKVVLARWLEARSRVLLCDEPTRGVDVGAKAEIYALLRSLAASGAGIVLVTSELSEALGLSDRLVVLREGRVAGVLTREEATAEAVAALMVPMHSRVAA